MRAVFCWLAWGGCLFAGAAPAQTPDRFPSQPIRLVIPMVAAGSTDVMARIVMPKMADSMGQPIVVDNRPGGNGLIGEELVARARPDGYTVMLESTAAAINPSLNAQSYDPLTAFLPVSQAAAVPLILVVNSTMQAQNVKELIAEVKAKPGAYTFASFGNGSIAHFAGEIFKLNAGLQMTHIAYKGSPQAVNDTLSGQVNMMFAPVPTVVQFVKSGKVRGLAITSGVRSNLAPEIPTMAEAGVNGMVVQTWFGLFLPTGTPMSIANRYYDEMQKAFKLPDVRTALDAQGFTVIASPPAEFSRVFRAEVERFKRVVKQAQIRADG